MIHNPISSLFFVVVCVKLNGIEEKKKEEEISFLFFKRLRKF
jgi:hypothetical protein